MHIKHYKLLAFRAQWIRNCKVNQNTFAKRQVTEQNYISFKLTERSFAAQ